MHETYSQLFCLWEKERKKKRKEKLILEKKKKKKIRIKILPIVAPVVDLFFTSGCGITIRPPASVLIATESS